MNQNASTMHSVWDYDIIPQSYQASNLQDCKINSSCDWNTSEGNKIKRANVNCSSVSKVSFVEFKDPTCSSFNLENGCCQVTSFSRIFDQIDQISVITLLPHLNSPKSHYSNLCFDFFLYKTFGQEALTFRPNIYENKFRL